MAVELVASALLAAAFDKLFERLTSTDFMNFFRGKKLLNDNLNALMKKLKTVSLLVHDAEDRQLDEPSVKEWLDDLKDFIFKVDDLVEEINSELRSDEGIEPRPVCCAWVPVKSIFTQFDKTLREEMEKLSEGLDGLLSRAAILDLEHNVPRRQGSSVRRSFFAPLREERSVYGRDHDKDEILEFLLSSDDDKNKIGVLPIVGMGGLGKTTLAQLAYDDERVKEDRFELRAWVTVSTDFDVPKIMKSILQQISGGGRAEEPTVLQREMKEALRGKKFLFVLDDVWDQNYSNWDLLMSNFVFGDRGSRIIVTTRSRRVCSNVKTGTIHELESVPADDCWKIFAHHAFDGDSNESPELEKIGKEIVQKCKGLPLAVKCVGGLLRSERDTKKWESILTSRVWSRNQEDGVLPSLWLSYRYLPSPVKQCFAYCAVFPQDYFFDKKDTVLMWMAEGFLQPGSTKEKSLEEVGDEYFEEMISRSFFQRHSRGGSSYVMHDLVRDLATFVSGEFCSSWSKNKNPGGTSSKTRYLFCDVKLECSDSAKVLGEGACLRTYVDESGRRNESTTNGLVKEVLEQGRFLRVLSVPKQNISKLLSSPGNSLKHLRYLNLSRSGIEQVPDSVCNLYNLQTLVLSSCERLSKLPMNTGSLINLRHLNIAYSDQIKKMPPRMGNLKELRSLTHFLLGKADNGCSSINELGELRHLAGKLCVFGLQNVETAENAREANFSDKGNLVGLSLVWKGGEETRRKNEREVLDALRPHANLEKLSVHGYPDSSFPDWVGDSLFSKMVSVRLNGSSQSSCRSLPPLGQLPSLKWLAIDSFNGVESIGEEFYGSDGSLSTPFPRLETLEFSDMKRWREWLFVGCFPQLRHLELVKCPNLGDEVLKGFETLENLRIRNSFSSMKCFPLDKFPRLKILSFNGCRKLKSLSKTSTEDGTIVSSITSLDIWNCPKMESFPDGGLPNSLNSLEIVNCGKLVSKNRHWDLHRLTSLSSIRIIGYRDFGANNDSDSFPQGLFPTSLTTFTLGRFQNVKTLNGSAFRHIESLQRLTINQCNKLESLPEQLLPNSLSHFEIRECPLLERRYRKETGDYWRYISHIPSILIWGNTTREMDKQEEKERSQRENSVKLREGEP